MKVEFLPLCGVFLIFALYTPSIGKPLVGCSFLAGIRYDDLRMCVATPAGVKGGPIADIMASIRFPIDDKSSVSFKIPVMRPVLFGAAFGMLQFEPEVTLEYRPAGVSSPRKNRCDDDALNSSTKNP